MRWHILGAGAIGCLFATRLTDAGLTVSLILRTAQQLERFQQANRRLRIQGPEGTRELVLDAELASAQAPISHLLVTTKAYDSEAAVAALQSRLTPDAQIVLLQNGLGHQQRVASQLAPRAVWAGITTCGAHRPAPFELTLAGDGLTRLGLISPTSSATDALPQGWQRLGSSVQAEPDIQRALWQKLAINAVINPLTALHGCRNGELLHDPALSHQLPALCREIEQIAAAQGQPLFDHPLLQAVEAVAAATAANFSSMLQDSRAGRPTEIDQINGYLCQVAQQHSLPAPLNRALIDALVATRPIPKSASTK